MPSLKLNFTKALKDFEEGTKEMIKTFKLQKLTKIQSKEAKHQRRLLIAFLRDHWTEYIKSQKW